MADNLEELQKKLYTEEKPTLPPVENIAIPIEEPIVPPPTVEDTTPSPAIWKKIFLGAGVFFLLAVTVAVYVFFRGFYAFRKDRIEIKINAPAEVSAGETVTWKLRLVNKNETELKDGILTFQFPDFSQPVISTAEADQFKQSILKQTINIPELKPSGLYEREFKAVVFGGDNFERKAQAVFNFKPSAGTIVFQSMATASIKISSFPVSLNVESSAETISGENVEVKFKLKNEGEVAFNNLRLRLESPAGFRLIESSEKLSEFNNVWRLDSVLPQEEKTLTIKGVVTGLEGEGKVFRALVEGAEGTSWKTYKEASGTVKLIMAPLALFINTSPDGITSARASETITYKIGYQNNLDIPLANLTLKVKFDSDSFNLTSVQPSTGLDSASKTVILNRDNTSNLFGLEPLEKKEITLKIKVKDSVSSGAKLPVTVTIESTTKPEGLAVDRIFSSQSLILETKGGD
ncbi:MAG: hypothetical protein Q8Q95_02320 [bacterium]|nr:hypothetical protein [bacterium]